jgi:hypothetical protein
MLWTKLNDGIYRKKIIIYLVFYAYTCWELYRVIKNMWYYITNLSTMGTTTPLNLQQITY